MFIQLPQELNTFIAIRIEDIISIRPVWHSEDCFSNYDLYVAGWREPIELTEIQGNCLINSLNYTFLAKH